MQQGTTSFASTNALTTWSVALLSFYILVLIIAIISGLLELQLVRNAQLGFHVSEADAATSDSRQQTIAIFQTCVYLTTGIVFLVWKNKSYKNLAALGAKGLEYSSGWAVGSYFVPFISLFRPFQIMREIWKACDPKSDIGNSATGIEWKSSSSSFLLPLWWTFFVTDVILGRISFRSLLDAKTLNEIYNASLATLLSDSIGVPLTIAAILLVKQINKRQESKYRERCKSIYAQPANSQRSYSNFKKSDFESIETYQEIDDASIAEKDKPRIYGAILGLRGRVSKQDIISTYKELMAKYHPDKVSHLGIEFQRYAEKKTKDINKAFSYLKKRFEL